MLDLIKELLKLRYKNMWLKTIDKEYRKCERLQDQARRQRQYVRRLMDRYNELYGEE